MIRTSPKLLSKAEVFISRTFCKACSKRKDKCHECEYGICLDAIEFELANLDVDSSLKDAPYIVVGNLN